MPSRRRITISTEGWYYLFVSTFIAIGAVLRQVNLLVVISGLLMGLLLFNWRLVVATLRRLEVRRRLPDHATVGESFLVDLAIANRRRWLDSWALVVRDCIVRERSDQKPERIDAEVMFPHVKAGGIQHSTYRCLLSQRGRYRFGRLFVVTRFPFGLVRGAAGVDRSSSLVVYPRLGRLTSNWKNTLGADRDGERQARRRINTSDGVFYGMRQWLSGDSRHWIHWRSSAKLNQLAVRQFEESRKRDVVLLLDLWQSDEATDVERENVELTLSFAATVVVDLCRRGGTRMVVATSGAEVARREAIASTSFMRYLLEQFAVVEAGNSGQFAELLGSAMSGASGDRSTIVISTRPAGKLGPSIRNVVDDVSRTGPSNRQAVWIDMSGLQWRNLFQIDAGQTRAEVQMHDERTASSKAASSGAVPR